MINRVKQLIANSKTTAESVLKMSRDEVANLLGVKEELSEAKYKSVKAFMARQIDINEKQRPAYELKEYLTTGKRQWFRERFPRAEIHMSRPGVIEIVLDGFEKE